MSPCDMRSVLCDMRSERGGAYSRPSAHQGSAPLWGSSATFISVSSNPFKPPGTLCHSPRPASVVTNQSSSPPRWLRLAAWPQDVLLTRTAACKRAGVPKSLPYFTERASLGQLVAERRREMERQAEETKPTAKHDPALLAEVGAVPVAGRIT